MARLLFASIVVLALASCASAQSDPEPTNPSGGETVVVEFVADGDTFRTADGFTLRLDGINAPESDECFYTEAADTLKGLIENSAVEVAAAGTDQFDRTLAQVFAGSEWVNLRMVAGGMALATTPSEDESDDLVEAEGQAFADRVGLWAADACGADAPLPAVAFDPDSSEVDPPGPDEDDLSAETVVVVNRGELEVDLSGWSIRDESSRHRYWFKNGIALRPGAAIVVTSADAGWDPGSSPVWNNGGDLALLIDPSGRVVDRHRY